MNEFKIGINFDYKDIIRPDLVDKYNVELIDLEEVATNKVINEIDVVIYKEDYELSNELKEFFKYFSIDYIKICLFNNNYVYLFDDEYTFNNLEECLEKINMSNNKERIRNIYYMLSTLNEVIEEREKGSIKHGIKVAYLSKKFAEYLNIDKAKIEIIYIGALLHDIGKIRIPEYILSKPSKLTDEEYEQIKKHTDFINKILPYREYDEIKEIILYHHERLDGSGYPKRLIGKEIPLSVRLVSIVDCYDAMTNERVYSETKTRQEAINELVKCTIPRDNGGNGFYFDANLVNNFIIFLNEYNL